MDIKNRLMACICGSFTKRRHIAGFSLLLNLASFIAISRMSEVYLYQLSWDSVPMDTMNYIARILGRNLMEVVDIGPFSWELLLFSVAVGVLYRAYRGRLPWVVTGFLGYCLYVLFKLFVFFVIAIKDSFNDHNYFERLFSPQNEVLLLCYALLAFIGLMAYLFPLVFTKALADVDAALDAEPYSSSGFLNRILFLTVIGGISLSMIRFVPLTFHRVSALTLVFCVLAFVVVCLGLNLFWCYKRLRNAGKSPLLLLGMLVTLGPLNGIGYLLVQNSSIYYSHVGFLLCKLALNLSVLCFLYIALVPSVSTHRSQELGAEC
jgi:hypothetical protein